MTNRPINSTEQLGGDLGGAPTGDTTAAAGPPTDQPTALPAGGRGGRRRLHVAGSRPRVQVGSDPETIRVLARELDQGLLPDAYVHDGAPVVLEAVSGALEVSAGDEDANLPVRVTTLKPPVLAGQLAEHAEVYRTRATPGAKGTSSGAGGKGEFYDEEVTPSPMVLGAVLARQFWPGLPPLRKVIGAPVLRPDGTLLQEPGYDPATGYYLAGRTMIEPVPAAPTADDVAAAREFLLDTFLTDFPWVSDADQANYLALLATPILRPYTRALSPFALVVAPLPGSGKTILTSCVGLMVGQKVLTWTDNEDELRKTITSVLSEAAGVTVWDNVEEGTVINSAVLARLVTERVWTDRKLGTNTATAFDNDRLWLATGNNLRTGGDMASRAVWVRLDPDCPHPEARTGFSIPNLDTWILHPTNQAVVLRHLLVLILDWTNAGAPPAYDVPAMRQFTKWAQQLGGFLAHHDVPGFLANAEEGRGLDEDAAEWRAFLLRWWALYGNRPVSANELRRDAEPSEYSGDPWEGTFVAALPSGKLPSVRALGRRLTGQVGRWRGDIVLRSVTDPATNSRTYWIEREKTRENAREPRAASQTPQIKPGNPETR